MPRTPASDSSAAAHAASAAEIRCVCGKLTARFVEAGIELKCGRCKRVNVLPWPEQHGQQPRHEKENP